MLVSFVVILQLLNVYIAWRITRLFASYLTISSLVFCLILIGSMTNELERYNSHEASLFLIFFNFLINAGALCKLLITKKAFDNTMQYPVQEVDCRVSGNELDLKIITAALLLFFMLAIYFFATYGAPIFYDNLRFARREIQKETHVYYRFFLYFIPISTGILYARYKVYKEKITKYLFIFTSSMTLLILLGLGFKGYVLWYLVFLLMLVSVYSNNFFKFSLMAFTLSLFAASYTASLMFSVPIAKSFELILIRSTVIAAYGYNMIFYELYPQISNVSFEAKSLNFFLAEWRYGNGEMSKHTMGITSTLPGALIMYFGKLGALLLAPVIGFIIQSFYVSIFKYKLSPLLVVSYMYLTFSFVGVVARGTVVTVFYQAILSLLLLFIFYIFLQAFLSGSGKYKYTKILFKNT